MKAPKTASRVWEWVRWTIRGIGLILIPVILAGGLMYRGFGLMLAEAEPILPEMLRTLLAAGVAVFWALGLAIGVGRWEGRAEPSAVVRPSSKKAPRWPKVWRTWGRATGILALSGAAAIVLWDWESPDLADIRNQPTIWATIAASGGIMVAVTQTAPGVGCVSRWFLRATWSVTWVVTCLGVAAALSSAKFREGVAGALVVYGMQYFARTYFADESQSAETSESSNMDAAPTRDRSVEATRSVDHGSSPTET